MCSELVAKGIKYSTTSFQNEIPNCARILPRNFFDSVFLEQLYGPPMLINL